MTTFANRYRVALVCAGLAVATMALYWPVTHHDFFNVDDPRFITQNPHVQGGLTWPGVVWAFHTLDTENWQPLTWLSHMLDCQLFGLNAGGHHLTSLLLHLANTLLLFLWLKGLTKAVWRSAIVAAFFALHPLHIESVAWACERKDVLSTFFWMLGLMAYTHYAQSVAQDEWRATSDATATSPDTPYPSLFYFAALFFFACGLMSKPMVVTLPCVLLLLDFWPLRRISNLKFEISNLRLIVEKIPFFALATAICYATVVAQKAGGALSSLGGMPLSVRVANSLANYAIYLGKTFWPTHLTYFYPYNPAPLVLVVGAVLVLAALTAWFALRVRREPYLVIGWLWFLGTSVPTIGLIHVGIQSRADRYMYIPSIGLFLMVVWGWHDLIARWPERRQLLAAFGGAALAGCAAATSIQIGYWQNSLTLSQHAIEVTCNNFVAYDSLGRALHDAGHDDQAFLNYAEAVRIAPEFPQSQFNLAVSLRSQGRLIEAAEHFATAARLVPESCETRNALGETWLLLNQPDAAAAEFSKAAQLKPDSADAHRNLGFALARQGNLTNAVPQFAEAVRLNPTNADAHFNLGLALLEAHQPAAAAAQFAEDLRLTPNGTKPHYRLAQALQQQGNFAEAVAHYRIALGLTPDFPEAKSALDQIFSAHPELK
jgi:protein O-mannosyl-transferase